MGARFRGTKLNAVLLGSVNADEIPALAQRWRRTGNELRFIELMPIGECADWPRERFLSADAVLHALPELRVCRMKALRNDIEYPAGRENRSDSPDEPPFLRRLRPHPRYRRQQAETRALHSAQEIPLRAVCTAKTLNAHCASVFGKPVSPHMQSGQPVKAGGMSQIGG